MHIAPRSRIIPAAGPRLSPAKRAQAGLLTTLGALLLSVATFGGCQSAPVVAEGLSPEQEARQRAGQAEMTLLGERDRLLMESQRRDQRIPGRTLSRLSNLRLALSLANVSMAAVPDQLQKPEHRRVAFAVLSEVYATISWNAPLSTSTTSDDGLRTMPGLFVPGVGLAFGSIRGGADVGTQAGGSWTGVEPLGPGAAPTTPPGFVR